MTGRQQNRTRLALVSATSLTTPLVAFAQVQVDGSVVGQTLYQGLVPNSWLVDANGNMVWLSAEDLRQYELAQVITPEAAVEVAADGASKIMGISTELLKQIGWYSVGAGGIAGAAAGVAAAYPVLMGAGEPGPPGPQGPAGPQGEKGPQGPAGPAGEAGQDATDGADGEAGQNGSDGDSAYQVWLDAGNTGLEEDFLNSLRGADGTDGLIGKSAYQIWTNAGNTRTH